MFDTNGVYSGWAGPTYPVTPSDALELPKMDAFTPRPAGNTDAWWQNLVSFGVAKAIDNTFPSDRRNLQGNVTTGSYAGQNGMSYMQRPPLLTGLSASTGIPPMMLLLIGGALVYYVVKS